MMVHLHHAVKLHHHGDAHDDRTELFLDYLVDNPSRRNSRRNSFTNCKRVIEEFRHVMCLKGWIFFADDARTKNNKIITGTRE